MEAENSQPTAGERSGGQEPLLSEAPLGDRLPQSPSLQHQQQQASSRPPPSSHGRQQHRQPKRIDLGRQLLRLQHQPSSTSVAGAAWQLADAPGPSGETFAPSSLSSSSSQNPPLIPPHCSQETQEAGPPRRERKPQKPGKYVCSYCGRPCAKPSVLQKHIRSHTGERPYPCTPCGFSFKTKSNLYKHRKSHAHRIKAGQASSRDDYSLSRAEGGEDAEEPTEGESTDSEDETGQHPPSSQASQRSGSAELSGSEEAPRAEDSQAVKQRLAMRLSERRRVPKTSSDDTPSSLGPGSKGSTESGYFSRSGSAELSQVSPPNTNAKSYAEIILGKYGRLGQQQRGPHQQHLQFSSSSSSSSTLGQEEKSIPFTVPKTQVIEHITKLITINEAVVDTSEIDSVKPRRSSLSRRSSIESVKFSSLKEPCVFDPKGETPGPSGSSISSSSLPMHVGSFTGDSLHPQLPDVDAVGGQATTVPLLRSQSMPSSAGQADLASTSSRSFRLSQSFDERQAVAAEMRVGHPHRMLIRQPAIEVPLGAELIPEEAGPSSASTISDPGHKQRRGPRLYECEDCGMRCKKRESYEIHRRSFCVPRLSQETEKGQESISYREDRPQMMHYKFRAMAMAVRKRRKEESLEEDPPSPGPAVVSFPLTTPTTVPSCEESSEMESSTSASSQVEQDRRSAWKEISVIQHTSSFEKQESMPLESQEKDKLEIMPPPCEEHPLPLALHTQQQQQPLLMKPHSFSRLVRQPNIQVPEILVTEEPDADMALASTSAVASSTKESEKVEEFQWPQRSQSLAQLPAEKLPPKKKRLRLAEATQSSGESSFESVSLPRSPSLESSVSHASSRSASFEESGKPDSEMQPASSRTPKVSHMLTVPSGLHQHHHSQREMRRSASEQAPASAQHHAQVVEVRSKSFDYGCLSPQRTTTTWKERRKCLLVKHATLGEPDQEEQPGGPPVKPSATQICLSHPSHPAEPSKAHSSSRLSPDTVGTPMQLLQSSVPPLSQSVISLCPPEAFPQEQLAQLFPATTGLTEVLSAQIIPRAFLQTTPPQLHPSQLPITDNLGLSMHPFPPLLPVHYSSGAAQALYLPLPSGLTLQVPTESHFQECKPSPSSLHSPVPYHPQHPQPRPVIAPRLEQLTPVVSLVVPVRLQTHIPTYASAMYTTLSQILVTTQAQDPICCSAMVLMEKLEEPKLQSPYLKIPVSKSYLPMTLSLEMNEAGSEEVYGPPGIGGSKRMLSPAGSLELSIEAQRQQKRVKEEDEEVEIDDEEIRREGGGQKDKGRAALEATTGKVGKEDVELREKKESKADKKEGAQVKAEPPKEETEDEGRRNVPRPPSPEGHKGPSYPSLHTATSVSWCYLNYVKPNPSPQRDAQTSVYSSWCISMHNPNLPGLSTRAALSLLCSKQKHSPEMYTMATATQRTVGKLVPTNSKPRMSEVCAARVQNPVEVKEVLPQEKEENKKGKREDEAPSTSKRSDPPRVRIFEGGYKSNEEYVYVRGRGRGKYVCEECGIRCKKPSMLKKHIRTHTDVRPYVCKYCNFAFKTKGNLTKHMKSKAHGKKCREMGVSGSSLDEPDAEEEAGGSEERVGGSEDQEEHQFSDVDDSEEDDDNEEEEEEEGESSSHEEPPSSGSPDTRASSGTRSEAGQPSRRGTPEREREPDPQEHQSPRRPWPAGRALFSHRHWDASPRAFSPTGGEGSPRHCLSPGREASPLHCLSPRLDMSSPSRHLSPSPERGASPIVRPLSPGRYPGPRALCSPAPALAYHRLYSLSPHCPGDTASTGATEGQQEQTGFLREGPFTAETSLFPPTPHLLPSPGDFPGHAPPQRTADHVFSHLPLHSQQLAWTPCLMIPIGGIQMVQPRPSSHPKLLRCPSSGPAPWRMGKGQLSARGDETQGGSPGPSSLAALEEAGTSQSGFCKSKQGVPSEGHAPSKTHVFQMGGEEPKEAGIKQYSSSRTYSKTSTSVTETTDIQTAGNSSGPRGPSGHSSSQPASPTHSTRQLPEREVTSGGGHRRRGSEVTRGGGTMASASQRKNSKTGST